MVNGILALVPSAKVGHIGLYRDEVTHEPHEYYCKLPNPIEERTIIVTDPMLATGGSGVAAVDFIKEHGGKKIKFMAIIAAPEGLERLHKAHPDIQVYVAGGNPVSDNPYYQGIPVNQERQRTCNPCYIPLPFSIRIIYVIS